MNQDCPRSFCKKHTLKNKFTSAVLTWSKVFLKHLMRIVEFPYPSSRCCKHCQQRPAGRQGLDHGRFPLTCSSIYHFSLGTIRVPSKFNNFVKVALLQGLAVFFRLPFHAQKSWFVLLSTPSPLADSLPNIALSCVCFLWGKHTFKPVRQ